MGFSLHGLVALVLASFVCGTFAFVSPSPFAAKPPIGSYSPRLALRGVGGRSCPATGGMRLMASAQSAEQLLLDTLSNTKGRGQSASTEQLDAIGKALDELEQDGGISDPILSPKILGEWELIYTSKSKFDITNPLGSRVDGSKPGLEGLFRVFDGPSDSTSTPVASSSPIQRSVTSLDSITITQDIDLSEGQRRVDNWVKIYKDSSYFRLSAAASVVPEDSTKRIVFTFDLAYLQIGWLRVPYPVPFQLLGKEASGWLDTTYLSDRLRVSKGNKGTTFVLARPGVQSS
uniref:Plastid lipid-associated protein/fibrillin conserved domain-containing protein n=2 Tax=Hemiselmis andersenii TaxID=464988 RepID=A0A7S0TIB1_HEMAN